MLKAIAKFFLSIGKKLEAKSHERAIYKELARLTDRELADIGISRGDIRAIAEGSFGYDASRARGAL